MINCPEIWTIVEKQIPLSQRKICAFWLEALGLVAASHVIIFLLLLLLLLLLMMMMMMMMMLMVMVIMNSPRAPIRFLFAEALVKESHQEIASTISEASLPSGKISTPKRRPKAASGAMSSGTRVQIRTWRQRVRGAEKCRGCEGLFRGRNKNSSVSTRWTLPKISVEVPVSTQRIQPASSAGWGAMKNRISPRQLCAGKCSAVPLWGGFFLEDTGYGD